MTLTVELVCFLVGGGAGLTCRGRFNPFIFCLVSKGACA